MPLRLPMFWLKLGLAAALAAAADVLFLDSVPGLNVGLFALALATALGLANPAVLRSRLGLAALAAAGLAATIQLDRPSFVALLIFVTALGVAALAPRAAAGDVWSWWQRLVVGAVVGLAGPFLDLRRLMKARARSRRMQLTAVFLAAVVPATGAIIFVLLFSAANPVIESALGRLRLGEPDLARLVFWGIVGLIAWMALRPRGLRRTLPLPGARRELDLPIATPASIAVSLVLFNAIFAVQNGLDIAFLWSGARLPHGMTFAQYAHRGAYPLIATALLAGLFVLVFLQPASKTASSPLVRWLVVAWVAQNVFLVASTALRTFDYIDAYSLTRMRIAALIWMGLVATGLVLIAWRLVRARSASWLINANALAVGLVLALCSVVDLGAVAAEWNVRHAREVGGRGVELDLCYLGDLHGAALVSLAELERRPIPDDLRERVRWKRLQITRERLAHQSDWASWRWRDARRLERARELAGPLPPTWPVSNRTCDGRVPPPPPPRPLPPAPLTPQPNPGT